MKTLEELKKMIEEWKEEHKDDEYFDEYKNYNFAAFDAKEEKISLFDSYSKAKNYAEFGGQVLVIDREKIYTYKIKNDEELEKYVDSQIKNDNFYKRNFYGL